MKDKILIAEDNLGNGLAALLAEIGLEAEVVANAKEAIDKIKTNTYLFVLTDMNMPLKKGEEINPKAGEKVVNVCTKKRIPCFVVTAGYSSHSQSDYVHILFTFNLFANNPSASLREIENFCGQKDVDGWKKVCEIVQEKFKDVLSARKRYIKYVLNE